MSILGRMFGDHPEKRPRKIYKEQEPNAELVGRNKEICDRYVAGESCGDLALAFQVTRERICQILRKNNLIAKVHERRRLAREALAEEAAELQAKARGEFAAKIERAMALVRNGESIRQAAIAIGFDGNRLAANVLHEKCREAGIKSRHGHYRDFSERERRLRELVDGGISLYAAVNKMRDEGEKIYFAWASTHCPDLVGRNHHIALPKEPKQSKPRRLPMRSGTLVDWTDDQIGRLIELWFNGNSAQQICDIFGPPFTRNAIIGKVHRLRNDGAFKRPDPPEPKPILSVVK